MTRTRNRLAKSAAKPPAPAPPAANRYVRIARWLIGLQLVGGPLIFLQSGVLFEHASDTPRRWVLLASAVLLLAVRLHEWSRQRSLSWRTQLLDLPVLLFLLAAIITGILGLYPMLSLFAPIWARDSVSWLALCVLFYLGLKEFLRDPDEIERAVLLVVLTGGIVAVIGLFGRLGVVDLNPSFREARLIGTLGNSMFTGLYFAMVIPLAAGLLLAATHRLRRGVALASLVVMLPALVLTLARSGWLGCAAALLVMGILALIRFRSELTRIPPWAWAGAGVLIAGMLALAFLLPIVRARVLTVRTLNDPAIIARKVYRQGAINIFRSRPLIGCGRGMVFTLFPQYRPLAFAKERQSINRSRVSALPHNLPLQIAAEMGVTGLLPFALLIVVLYVTGLRLLREERRQAWLAIGLLGMGTAYLIATLFCFDSAATLPLFWTGLALLAALAAHEQPLFRRRQAEPFRLPGVMVRLFGVVSGLLIALTLIAVCTEMTTAAAYHRARLEKAAAESLLTKDPKRSFRLTNQGLNDIDTVVKLTPTPYFVCYELQALLYRVQYHAARGMNDSEQSTLSYMMMDGSARQTLRLLDRDPAVLRMLVIEYTDQRQFHDAERTAADLQRFEPYSAQVHLLKANLLLTEGKTAPALEETRQALFLDPEYGTAHLQLARVQSATLAGILNARIPGRDPQALITGKDAEGMKLVEEISTSFAAARRDAQSLTDADILNYATALFLQGKTDDAMAEAQSLHGKREMPVLQVRITNIYGVRGKLAEGQKLIADLAAPPDTPVSPPPARSGDPLGSLLRLP